MLFLVLAACSGPYSAPYGSTLTLNPESYTLKYGEDFYDRDGIGMAMYGWGFVSGPDTRIANGDDVPLNNVQIMLSTTWSGAYLLPPEAVKAVNTLEDSCSDGSTDEECAIFYDNSTGYSYEVSGEYAYFEDLQPNVLYAQTDNTGAAPFWVFFDSLPFDDSDTSFDIVGMLNEQEQAISVTVQEPVNG